MKLCFLPFQGNNIILIAHGILVMIIPFRLSSNHLTAKVIPKGSETWIRRLRIIMLLMNLKLETVMDWHASFHTVQSLCFETSRQAIDIKGSCEEKINRPDV